MKIWKALAAAFGVAAAAAFIPYKVEKDDETETTTVKALAWTAVKTPNQEDGGTQVDVTFLPGLSSAVHAEDADATEADPEAEEESAPDPEEAEMFDDSVNLADIIPDPDKV